MGVLSTVMTPFNMVGMAARHVVDIDVGYGLPSSRYNARNAYRTTYKSTDRTAAGLGTAAAVALPVAAAVGWASKGMRVPGTTGFLATNLGRAVGLASLGGMAAVGAFKLKDIIEDDGHFGSLGATAGIGLGGFVGWRMLNSPLIGGGLALAGGIGGYLLGKSQSKLLGWNAGPGHIGQEIANQTKLHEDFPGSTIDFGRGFFNHFTEAGPTSQGVSLGYRWGMRKTYDDEYSKTERGGAMVGDLAAAAILGGGALAVGRRVLSGQSPEIVSKTFPSLAARWNNIMAGTQALSAQPGANAGMGIIAAGLTGWALTREYKAWSGDGDNPMAGAAAVGITAGIGALGYLAARNSAFVKGMAPGAQPMAGLLTGAVLISALSAARMPVQQFINDAQGAWKAHPADRTTAIAASGVGAVGGAFMGFKLAQRFTPASIQGLPKIGILAAGTLIGAAAGGATGVGLSASMPDLPKVAISGGVGAAALGALSLLVTRSPRSALTGAAVGGVLGVGASSLLAGGQGSTQTPQTPQDVAGTISP